jgi:hypothetical protein
MRKLIALAASLAVVVMLATPASANQPPVPTCFPGVGPCTETDHFTELTFLAGPMNCPPSSPFSGWAIGAFTGNAVQHITVNGAQDFWVTSTIEGQITFSPILPPDFSTNPPTITPDPSRPTIAGQATAWFGFEGNLKNFVFHDTGHFHGSTLPPFPTQSVDLHFQDHVSSTGANPFVPHTVVMHLSC